MKFQVVKLDYYCSFCYTTTKKTDIYRIYWDESTDNITLCKDCLAELRKAINEKFEEVEK